MDDIHVTPGTSPSQISGFYGPGSLGGWFFIVGSTILTAARDAMSSSPPDHKASTLLVAEMTAAIFYPLVAAGDLCVKLASRTRDWPAIQAVLAQPYEWVFAGLKDDSASSNHPPWDTPPSETLISECMSLVLPLVIILLSTGVLVIMHIICFLFPGRIRKTCQLILLGSFIFLLLDALVALNMAMASPFWFMMMCLQYLYLGFACLFMVPLCTIPLCLACPAAAYFCFITLFVEIRRALRRPSRFDLTRRNLRKGIRKLLFWFAMLLVGSVALSGPFTMLGIVLPSIFSDIGLANVPFSMGELDQWAALCSGVITFAFSAYEAIPWRVLIVAYVDVWRKLTSPLWEDSAEGHGYERAKLEV